MIACTRNRSPSDLCPKEWDLSGLPLRLRYRETVESTASVTLGVGFVGLGCRVWDFRLWPRCSARL